MKELTRRQFAGHALAAAAFAASVSHVPFAVAATLMAKRNIPSTGVELGILGFGNSAVFNARTDVEEAKQTSRTLFDLLVEMGGNFVDSYHDAYLNLAQWLDIDVIRQVHFSAGFAGFGRPLAEDDIPGLPGLMQNAQLAFLTVHQHLDMSMAERYWPVARRAKEAGYARHIGVSWRSSPMLMRSSSTSCRRENPTTSYQLLHYEIASRKSTVADSNGSRHWSHRDAAVPERGIFQAGEWERIARLGDRVLRVSGAQFCLKYIVSHPAVTVAISETNNLEHARDNLGAGIGRLPDEATRTRMQEFYASLPSAR